MNALAAGPRAGRTLPAPGPPPAATRPDLRDTEHLRHRSPPDYLGGCGPGA